MRCFLALYFILFIGSLSAQKREHVEPPCPDFSSPAKTKSGQVKISGPAAAIPMQFQVIDATSGQPLVKAQIEVQDARFGKKRLFTNSRGRAEQENTLAGPYYIICNKPGYQPEVREILFNRSQGLISFALHRIEERPTFPIYTMPEKAKKEEMIIEEKKDSLAETKNIGELSRLEFKPNNVVFLIDISSSMAMRQRLPLLKQAMKELLAMLRDIDKIAIVTYASTTQEILAPTPANQKELIAAMIDTLQAQGLTAGEKGIELAYQIAEKGFLKEGNNEIFIATDGAFNVGGDQTSLYPYIKKQAQKNIHLSVLGIKHASMIEEDLKNLAKHGQGTFVPIAQESEAAKLLETIKQHSRK